MPASPLRTATERLDGAAPIDRLAGPVRRVAARATAPAPIKAALSGEWLGHALHPLLTDVVIGAFTSATILDLLGGDDDAISALLAVGIVAYPATAVSGVSDWADTGGEPGIRRTGLVHAAVNAGALSLYVASLAARRAGDRGRARLLGLGGASVLGAGGYLGAHLAYVRGARAERATPAPPR